MSSPEQLAPLVAALRDLTAWFDARQVPAAVIGGVAVSLLGRARVTRDIDAVVLLADQPLADFLAGGEEYGFIPRIRDAEEFASRSRVVLLLHQPSGIEADVSLGALPFEEESVRRAQRRKVAGYSIPVITPEDLIVMKAVAHRDRDLIDIEGVVAANPNLDLKRVHRWVADFASVLEMPELLEDLQRLLPTPPTKKGRRT